MSNAVVAEQFVSLSWLDLTIFFGSLVVVMAVGMWASRQERDTLDFFLAGREMKWWAVAGSIFGSNISSHHLVGMSGIGFAVGFAQANFEFGAIVGLMVLSFLFLPIYRRLGVYTLSQFLDKRFDQRSLVVYSGISILNLVVFEMVATLYIGSSTLEVLFGWDYRWGVLLTCVVTGIYTVFGGLKAVIYTDVMQSALLIVGGVTVAYLALGHEAVGGIGGLIDKEPERFHVFFPLNHPELPWLGVLTGLMVLHFNYWGANQFIVQRALGARSLWDGRVGIVTAGFFKLMIPFITIVPGMAAGHLVKDAHLFELPVKNGHVITDMTYPLLMKHLLPSGLMGLALAGLAGAIFSTVDSMMNSAATLFTFDFYRKYLRKAASERELIAVGRLSIVAILLISGLWSAFLYDPEGHFFLKLYDNISFFSIGMITAFLVGITWKGATPTASFVVMLLGPVVSAGVNVLWSRVGIRWAWLVRTFAVNVDGVPKLNYFYRIGAAFAACVVLLVLISRWTSRERRPNHAEMVWPGAHDPAIAQERRVLRWWNDDRLWAGVLVAIDVALCIYFA